MIETHLLTVALWRDRAAPGSAGRWVKRVGQPRTAWYSSTAQEIGTADETFSFRMDKVVDIEPGDEPGHGQTWMNKTVPHGF
jgi:hypothetical protein